MNRLDQIVAYHPLSSENIRQIPVRVLDQALAREGLFRHGVSVTCPPPVVDRLAELGFDARYGARPLKRAVEQHVVSAIAALIAEAGELPPKTIALAVAADGTIVAAAG